MTKKFYVTSAIDYASGDPHIGHAYEKISSDVIARWNRIIGKDVYFLAGTDEHGQKIEKKAKENSQDPQKFVDEKTEKFKELFSKLNISYDHFIRTTDTNHKDFVKKVLQTSYENGDIYKGLYEGLYCIDCEQYYKENDLEEGNTCPVHKIPVSEMREEAYFFRLSKYQYKILELYRENPEFISPDFKKEEILNRVEEGLEDVCISRSKSTTEWGVEIPFDTSHVTYVWFDALFNYISGLEINGKQDHWPANVHIIGHDIAWFHVVYWPAFLMSTGYSLPKKVFSHGMVLDGEGHKMSKSKGNVVDPFEFTDKHGVDEFRYSLLALGTYGDDVNFSEEIFAEKVNNDLKNDLGNLISRIHTLTTKYFHGKIPSVKEVKDVDRELFRSLDIFDEFNKYMQELNFFQALKVLWKSIRDTNAYINETTPWKEDDKDRLATIINILVSSARLFGSYAYPFIPEKSSRLFQQLGFSLEDISFEIDFTKESHKLGEKDNLFSKVELSSKESEKEDKSSNLQREGFSKLSLKVGEIVDIEQHPQADKLYVEKVDVGEEEPRQIVSGLKNYYSMEELKGMKVIVIANLKPAKLRGEKSEGMVLASEDEENDKVGLLTTDAPVGSYISTENAIADNPTRIKPDDFFSVELQSDGTNIYYQNSKLYAQDKEIKPDKQVSGKVS